MFLTTSGNQVFLGFDSNPHSIPQVNITMTYVAVGEPSVYRAFPSSQALATEAGVEPITLLVHPAPDIRSAIEKTQG